MNQNQLVCDFNQIDLFFSEQLSETEQHAFEAHLSECASCREKLQATAASDEFRADMRASLQQWDQPAGDLGVETTAGEAARFHYGRIVDLLAPSDDERMLGRLGAYEIAGVVGSGGMGVVLKAFDRPLNRYVAIKLLAPHLAGSAAARQRFSREAQAAAAVVHENVIEIHNVSSANGLPYLVMPYVPGPSLQKRLDAEGPLQMVEILRIGVQAAAGLSAAHAQGLVHRDVKPANIMLADNVERLKLTDFGLARAADDATLTKTGVIAGTPQYMSPEQARGESVDYRSDLFSLGSVLYTLCTGRPPFRAETSYGVLRQITDCEPLAIQEINADTPVWLCEIIAKLMAKDAGERFQSASEVAELLKDCLAHVQQPLSTPLPPSLTPKPKPRQWFSSTSFGVIAMISCLLLGSLGILGWQATQPHDIGGNWSGDGWGEVTLNQTTPGSYEGTYTDTFGEEPGTLVLQWSRLERRYKGNWSEGKDRKGKISLRRYENEIRGAWTTSKRSKIQPGAPELADLLWKPRDDARVWRPKPDEAISHVSKQQQRVNEAELRFRNAELSLAKVIANGETETSAIDHERARLALNAAKQSLRIEQVLLQNMRSANWPKNQFDLENSSLNNVSAESMSVALQHQKLAKLEYELFNATLEHERALTGYGADHSESVRTAKVVQQLKNQLQAAEKSLRLSPAPGATSNDELSYEDQDGNWRGGALRTVPTPHAVSSNKVKHDHKRLFRTTLRDLANVMAYSLDGEKIAIGGDDSKLTIISALTGMKRIVIDVNDGKEKAAVRNTWRKSDAVSISAVAFSFDSKRLAVGTSVGQVKVFDASTGELQVALDAVDRKSKKSLHEFLKLPLAHNEVARVAFSRNGKYIATCGSEVDYRQDGVSRLGRAAASQGVLMIWDAKTGKLLHDIKGHFYSFVADVAFSLNGKYLAAAGQWQANWITRAGVKVFDPESGKIITAYTLPKHHHSTSVCFTNDSKRLFVGAVVFHETGEPRGGVVYSIRPDTGLSDASWQTDKAPRPLFVSQLGRSLVAISSDDKITYWNPSTGEQQTTIRPEKDSTSKWRYFALSPTNDQIAIVGVNANKEHFVEVQQLGAFDRKEISNPQRR